MLQSIILGAIQGITEFLPISSSAHLIFVPIIFNFSDGASDSLFFDVSLHFGTLLSVILYFRREWAGLIKGFFSSVKNRSARTADEKLVWYLIFATLPAAGAGVFLEDTIDRLFHTGEFGSIIYITVPLTIVSILMLFSERASSKENTITGMTFKDAMIIGMAQAFALVPGVSRSAITICAGLLLGYRRDESARFSFLLSTPVIFGAFLLKFIKSYGALNTGETGMYITGTISSALVGYFSIKYLLMFLSGRKLDIFAYYRIAIAALLIGLFLSTG